MESFIVKCIIILLIITYTYRYYIIKKAMSGNDHFYVAYHRGIDYSDILKNL